MSDDHEIIPAEEVSVQPLAPPVTIGVDPVVSVLMQRPAISAEEVRDMLSAQREYRADMARQEFDQAFAALSVDLPRVIAKDKGVSYGSGNAYKYATLATILSEVKPVLAQYGFTVRWQTQVEGQSISVTCELRHRSGHIETNSLSGPPDSKGGKSQIQAIGSTVSYLSRYTLIASLGITTGDMPDADDRQRKAATGIDTNRNLRVLAKLRREYGIEAKEAEDHIGKPAKEWTSLDIESLANWLRERTVETK